MAVSRGQGRGGCVAVGRNAEADGLGAAGEGELDLGELVVGGGEADLEPFGFAGPALAFGFGDAGGQVAADVLQPLFLGGVNPEEGTPDECSWMQLDPQARPQSPRASRRRSKWPRNSSHSESLGVRYSSLGRSSRRRAMNARWPLTASSG
jgi:hypothetical protein